MLDNNLMSLLALLSESEYLTSQELAVKSGASSRTVQTRIGQLRAELGVESTHSAPTAQPLSQLYVTNKLIELMILYRRYVMAVRGEKATARAAART